MFEKSNSFYVFEFIEACPQVEEVASLLRERPFVDISENDGESDYCYVGPDHINAEKNFIVHPGKGLLAFSILFQMRKINKELVDKELERVLAEEYFGQKLSKDDINLVKDTVLESLMGKFPIVYKYSDVILDQINSRIYVRSSGDGLLFNTIRQINAKLNLESTAMRPWFSGEFIEKAGSWENIQTIFLHWLNGVCQKENKYNIFAGTKIDFRDSSSRVKITGDHARFSSVWELFQYGRRIDSVQVILKEKVPKDGDREEYFEEVLQYKLNVKKLGFYDLRFSDYYGKKVRSPEALNNKVMHLESFLSHFDSLCVAFQTSMKSFDMKDLYSKIIKSEEEKK